MPEAKDTGPLFPPDEWIVLKLPNQIIIALPKEIQFQVTHPEPNQSMFLSATHPVVAMFSIARSTPNKAELIIHRHGPLNCLSKFPLDDQGKPQLFFDPELVGIEIDLVPNLDGTFDYSWSFRPIDKMTPSTDCNSPLPNPSNI